MLKGSNDFRSAAQSGHDRAGLAGPLSVNSDITPFIRSTRRQAAASSGDNQPQRASGLKIDHELKSRRLQDRQIGGFGAFENLAGVDACLLIAIGYARTVADETARYSEFAKAIEGRKPFLCRERNNLLASGVKVRTCRHQQRCRLFVGPVTRRPRSTLDYYCLRHEESQIERPCGLLAAGTPAHWPEDSRPTVRLASDQCPRWVNCRPSGLHSSLRSVSDKSVLQAL